MSNALTRILVALVAIPAIVYLVIQGGWWFFIFVQFLALLGLKEFYDMAARKTARPNRLPGYLALLGLGFTFFFPAADPGFLPLELHLFGAFVVLLLLIVVTLGAELWRGAPHAIANVSVTTFGVSYVSMCMAALIGIRDIFSAPWVTVAKLNELPALEQLAARDEWGALLLIFMFASIWMCDSSAYFVGMSFGKHKLFPRISPKKSWEGAIAGFVGSALAFSLLCYFFLPALPLLHAVILGLLIGVAGQLGDLAESLLKRDAGIKDSSKIIPGHGGILDRFDSVLFVAPVVYIYLGLLWLKLP